MLYRGSSPKILFVNPYGIGDVLFTTPAIKIVKNHYLHSIVGYLCNERTQLILESNPLVNEVFIFEKDQYREKWRKNKGECLRNFTSLLKEIAKRKFDMVLDYSLNRQFGFFLALLGIPIRIGFDYKNRGLFLNRKIPIQEYTGQPMPVLYSRLVEKMNLIVDTVPPMEFFIPESVKVSTEASLEKLGIEKTDRFIVVHPGGGISWGLNAVYKRWPLAFYTKLVELLRKHYRLKLLLLGDCSEQEAIKGMEQEIGDSGVMNVCGQMDLLQLASLLGKAWFAICNDGGPLHIAVSQGTPTVSFFGPVDERVYGPFPSEGHLVFTHPVECRPCYRHFRFPPCPFDHRCLKDLSVEDVFRKIKERFQ